MKGLVALMSSGESNVTKKEKHKSGASLLFVDIYVSVLITGLSLQAYLSIEGCLPSLAPIYTHQMCVTQGANLVIYDTNITHIPVRAVLLRIIKKTLQVSHSVCGDT